MASPTTWAGTTGDWTSAGNWTNGVPIAGGDVYFTQDAAVGPDTNLAAELDFAKLVLSENFKKDIGTATASLVCGCDEVWHRGKGSLYLKADVGASPADIDTVRQYDGFLFLDTQGRTTATVLIEGGRATLQNGIFTSVTIKDRVRNGSKLTVDAAVDTLTSLTIESGQVVSSFAGHDVIELHDGSLVLQDDAAITTGSAILRIYGGMVEFNCTGGITTVEQYGGTFTARRNQADQAITIATFKGYGGFADLRSHNGVISVTSMERWGDEFRFRVGAVPDAKTPALADI